MAGREGQHGAVEQRVRVVAQRNVGHAHEARIADLVHQEARRRREHGLVVLIGLHGRRRGVHLAVGNHLGTQLAALLALALGELLALQELLEHHLVARGGESVADRRALYAIRRTHADAALDLVLVEVQHGSEVGGRHQRLEIDRPLVLGANQLVAVEVQRHGRRHQQPRRRRRLGVGLLATAQLLALMLRKACRRNPGLVGARCACCRR